MRRRKLFLVGGGLALAIGLLAIPLYASELGRSTVPSPLAHVDPERWVCPLTYDQSVKAKAAFSPIGVFLASEPRCVNCHGKVNPFSADAADTHDGGSYDLIFRAVPASAGVPAQTELDEASTFAACQDCHSDFPGWRIPPEEFFFAGKDPPTLCQQMKHRFGLAPRFIEHMQFDLDRSAPFVLEGFKGTMGMNRKPPLPPTGVTQAQLIQMSNDWVGEMDGLFRGDEECGCVPHHYALKVDITTELVVDVSSSHTVTKDTSQGQIPITVKEGDLFEGTAQFERKYTSTTTAPDITCVTDASYTDTWQMNGTLDDIARTIKVKPQSSTPSTTGKVVCTTPAGTVTQNFATGANTTTQEELEMSSMLNVPKNFVFPLDHGKSTINVTVIQID